MRSNQSFEPTATRVETKSWWLLFAFLVALAAVWQGSFAVSRESWFSAFLLFGFQVLGAQVLVCWPLNLRPAVAQVKRTQELAESPHPFIAAGLVIFVSGAAGTLLPN